MRWVKEFVVLGINFSVHLDQLEGLNFEKKIIEIEKLFDVYSMFNLSLVGKLTVIKTLALPKLVYLLSVLPTPSDTIFNILETKINNFIWKGKERISQKQLQKDISNGGLNLTNLRMFNKALKLTWIKRLVQNSRNWQNIFEVSIGLNKKHVWELDMQSLNCIRKGIQNQFWKDDLSSWMHFKAIFNVEIDPRTYPIFGSFFSQNENIKKLEKQFEQVGINYINDLFDQDGRLGYEGFAQHFDLNLSFVDLYSLIHSVPRDWKFGFTSAVEMTECFMQKKRILLA